MELKLTAKLPPANKPWLLIRLALQDLIATERQNSKYKINMGAWHLAVFDDGLTSRQKCEVCLAGCVMAQTAKVPITDYVDPESFSPSIRSKLMALDYFRIGQISSAYEELGLVNPYELIGWFQITHYTFSPRLFKRDMRKLADYLEKFHKRKPADEYLFEGNKSVEVTNYVRKIVIEKELHVVTF